MEKISTEIQLGLKSKDILKKVYPEIYFGEYRFISDPKSYLIVDDISDDRLNFDQDLRVLQNLCIGVEEIYSMKNLTESLVPPVASVLSFFSPEEALFIYPGGGGKRFRQHLPQGLRNGYGEALLQIQREFNPVSGKKEPRFDEGEKYKLEKELNRSDLKAVFVCDDAINEGGTLKAIRSLGDKDGLEWFAFSPILFSPVLNTDRLNSPSSLFGYKAVITSKVLEGIINPVPLNFLSSLIKRDVGADRRVIENLVDTVENEEERREVINLLSNMKFKYEERFI